MDVVKLYHRLLLITFSVPVCACTGDVTKTVYRRYPPSLSPDTFTRTWPILPRYQPDTTSMVRTSTRHRSTKTGWCMEHYTTIYCSDHLTNHLNCGCTQTSTPYRSTANLKFQEKCFIIDDISSQSTLLSSQTAHNSSQPTLPVLWNRNYSIYCGSDTGSDFWQVTVPVQYQDHKKHFF